MIIISPIDYDHQDSKQKQKEIFLRSILTASDSHSTAGTYNISSRSLKPGSGEGAFSFKICVRCISSSYLQLPARFQRQNDPMFLQPTVAYTAMPVGASIGGPGSHLPYIVTSPAAQGAWQSPPVAPPVAPPLEGAAFSETS